MELFIVVMQDLLKGMVERFIEYVMHNHLIYRKSATTLQALQISLVRIFFSVLGAAVSHLF